MTEQALEPPSTLIYQNLDYFQGLMSRAEFLAEEFRSVHPDWDTTGASLANLELDKRVAFLFYKSNQTFVQEVSSMRYPQAGQLARLLESTVPEMGYEIWHPGWTRNRHHTHNPYWNPQGNQIRINIPIIVPEEGCYMEVCGQKQNSAEPFAYIPRYLHSKYNTTDQRALIMYLELPMSVAGIEPPENDNLYREIQLYNSKVEPWNPTAEI
jgi:hypothetical protein